jgi:HSP20 family protein
MNQPMNLKSLIPWKKEERAAAHQRQESDPFLALQHRMNGLFDDLFGRSSSDSWPALSGRFMPQTEVSESEKEVRISAELPGLDEKDIEVTVAGPLLTIKGEKKAEKEEKNGGYWRSERSYGYFERAVHLPAGIDPQKARATFKQGVLKVTFPKKPEAQSNRRRIQLLDN